MALSKIQSESVNLSDNFAFTGTVTGAGLTSPFANTVAVTSEGGAVTTNVVQGLAKSWIYFEQIGTHQAYGSFNIASITDAGTGRSYPIAFTNSMSDGNYSGSYHQSGTGTSGYLSFNNGWAGSFSSKTTASFGCRAYGTADVDAAEVNVTVVGDLA